jgi:hypothetical protein
MKLEDFVKELTPSLTPARRKLLLDEMITVCSADTGEAFKYTLISPHTALCWLFDVMEGVESGVSIESVRGAYEALKLPSKTHIYTKE